MSLSQRLRSLTRIEDWHEHNEPPYNNYLDTLFTGALYQDNVFEYIYIAIRDNPRSAADEGTDRYTYYNVGFTTEQMSSYFNTRYGLNYFAYRYDVETEYNSLKEKVKSIYLANKYKYLKLIELLGYKYNPLYNVDGTELYSNMESLGDSASSRKPSGTITTTSGTLDTDNKIGASTTTNYTNPYDENTSQSADFVSNKAEQSAITTEQSYSDDYEDKTELNNIPANHYTWDSQTQKPVKAGIFSVAAADSAFGVALGGAERYYAEKRIRQGNIGVTKSSELVASQREVVQFNILDEFFRDLEREIVVGIY